MYNALTNILYTKCSDKYKNDRLSAATSHGLIPYSHPMLVKGKS